MTQFLWEDLGEHSKVRQKSKNRADKKVRGIEAGESEEYTGRREQNFHMEEEVKTQQLFERGKNMQTRNVYG